MLKALNDGHLFIVIGKRKIELFRDGLK